MVILLLPILNHCLTNWINPVLGMVFSYLSFKTAMRDLKCLAHFHHHISILHQSRTQFECLHGRADEFRQYGYNAVPMQSDSVNNTSRETYEYGGGIAHVFLRG